MKRYLGLTLALATVAAIGTAGGGAARANNNNIVIKGNYFKFNNYRYYRNNAEKIQLGSYGEKRTPLGGRHELIPHSRISSGNLDKYAHVHTAFSGPIDWTGYSSQNFNFGAGVQFIAAGGSVDFAHSASEMNSGHLELMELYIDEGPMENTLNHSGACLTFLDDEGSDGRVADVIWVVIDGDLASTVANSNSIGVSGTYDAIDLSVGGGGGGGSTVHIHLTPGQTFAYNLVKVSKWGKHHESVDDLKPDPQN